MLDNGNRRFAEIVGCTKRSIGIDVVVIRHVFAAVLASLGDAGQLTCGAIERSRLVRVFAVAKHRRELTLDLERADEARILARGILALVCVFAPFGL